MQPGNYTTYADRFSELSSQLRGLNPTHMMYMFPNGLTSDYKQHAPVATWIWRPALLTTPAFQRWLPSNVIPDHPHGVSPRPVHVATDLKQDLPANGVVYPREGIQLFADAHRPLTDLMTPAPVPNRGEPHRAARLR